MDAPQTYCQIAIAGPLNERWADYVGDMFIAIDVQEGRVNSTTLIGRPHDLAAYIGMLSALANLGQTIIATEYQQLPTGDATTTNVPNPCGAQGARPVVALTRAADFNSEE